MRRVALLGLRPRGKLARFVGRVSDPSSSSYRRFATPAQFRSRFSARARDRRRVLRFLGSRPGVKRVQLSSTRTTVLAVLTPKAAARLFCATDPGVPLRGLCTPNKLRGIVRQVSIGESYELAGGQARESSTPAV